MKRLEADKEKRLLAVGAALIDQHECRVVVAPYGKAQGFWFGGGNCVQGADGCLYLSGRYRNPGDSRFGLGKGERGMELAVFASSDEGATFEKVHSFSKEDLSRPGDGVISIEGSANNPSRRDD